ncbi:hypothetical protein KKB64_01510 [Patescibacteria group bacterium]|nr:hypothetical protein [Patescibacteria group bacterium]MBU1472448.1 hypothetical protein [Patescibacteria group bacterium]
MAKLTTLKNTHVGSFIAKDITLVETNAGAHPSKTRILGTYEFGKI